MNTETIQQIEQNLATHKRLFLQSDEMIQEEPKEFRQVPSDYFNIRDDKQIEELSSIIKQNLKNKKNSFQLQGLQSKSEQKETFPEFNQIENSFSNKMNNLFSVLDSCKKKIENEKSLETYENKYVYYNLDDVEYKEKEVISEAFAFLRDLDKEEKLKKKREQMANDEQILEEEFDILTFKPSYQQSSKRTQQQDSQIKIEEQKLKTRLNNLTIEDEEEEEDNEYEIIEKENQV